MSQSQVVNSAVLNQVSVDFANVQKALDDANGSVKSFVDAVNNINMTIIKFVTNVYDIYSATTQEVVVACLPTEDDV